MFGEVERIAERNFFVVSVPDRSRVTSEQLILSHVKAGSNIHSNCWDAYNELNLFEFENNLRYHHLTVYHSVVFLTEGGVKVLCML